MFIPTSLPHLGAYMLVLAVALVFLDVPGKGVPWDKVGGWFAAVGGFGVGGSAGGWLGGMFASAGDSVITSTEQITAQALGVGVVGAIVSILVLWAYSRLRGKGITAKSKFKSLLVTGGLAVVGTVVAAIPGLYGFFNDVVGQAGTLVISAIG
jgi:hypothetical protein